MHDAWYAKNKEQVAAYQAAYRNANIAKAKAGRAAYHATNRDKIKAQVAAFYAANRDKEKARTAAYHTENRDKIKVRKAVYRTNNPDKHRIRNHNYRAMKKYSGKLSQGLAAKIYALQKGKCVCCSEPLGNDYHLDHIMPLALGGKNIDRNIQLLRPTCNQKKHAKPPEQFMRERGFLL